MTITKIHQHTFTQNATDCNPQGHLSPQDLVRHLIQVATEAADLLGCGWDSMRDHGTIWVLSRLAFEMESYPRAAEKFTVTTWVESFNRLYSSRCFEITDGTGKVIGYARSMWVPIDFQTRRPARLEDFSYLSEAPVDRPCPIAPPARLRVPRSPSRTDTYTFRVSDLDLNRHVRSVAYVELAIDQLTPADYDSATLRRLDIDYRREAHWGDSAEIAVSTASDGGATVTDVAVSLDGEPVNLCRLTLISNNTI